MHRFVQLLGEGLGDEIDFLLEPGQKVLREDDINLQMISSGMVSSPKKRP